MDQSKTATHIRIAFAVLAGILLFAWGTNISYADEHTGPSMSIAPNGQLIVKGATVTGVYGNIITAEASWGPMTHYWTIQTTGSTRFSPDIGSEQALSSIEVGHRIGFTGTIAGQSGKPVVLATAVKDAELVQESVSVVGTVEQIDTGSKSFVIRTANGQTTVMARRGLLMTRNGENASFEDLVEGDVGKATGSFDVSSGILTAARISVKEAEKLPTVMPETSSDGVFASIMTWLKGSRGILSVRDR